MDMNRNLVWQSARAAVAFSLAALAAACTGGGSEETQSIEGQVARSNFESKVLGVRAVSGDEVVARAPVTENGHFRLQVPLGDDYRLEVVTETGAHPFVSRSGEAGRKLVFDVCSAGAAYDVGHVHGWDQSDPDGGGGCSDPCMEDPSQCDPCTYDPESCEDPCRLDPSLCEDPCQTDPDSCQDPCMIDPESCQDPCRDDPSLCDWTCDEEGNCCYGDGTCCDAAGNCCYPDGTCCGMEGCCYPDGTCDPPPCDPSDPDGDCYCNEQDPTSQCYCNPEDPASYCYCNEQDPGSYCYCNPEDPMSYCYPQPCESPDGTVCCDQGTNDEMCWPEPEPEPVPCDDGTMNEECWKDGAVPDNSLPNFGCEA
jgi:hypothetical protein